MKLLVADIGGTNARFAYQEKNNSDLNNFAYLKCSDYENIYDAIEHYQQKNNLEMSKGVILLNNGNLNKALKVFLNLCKIEPEWAEPFNKVATIKFLQKDYIGKNILIKIF